MHRQWRNRLPDGYTFLYDATSFTVNPSLFPKLGFDYGRDFAPVGMVARVPTLLVVPADSPVNSVADLVQRARANPGKTNYASAGNGGAAHLSAELFEQGFKLGLIHVPYKGGAPALTDLAGGQVDMMFSAITASGPLVKAGRLKAIATAFDRRIESMPQLPTVAESGLPGLQRRTSGMRSGHRRPRQPTSSRAWKPSCAKHWRNRPFANAWQSWGRCRPVAAPRNSATSSARKPRSGPA